MESDGSLPEGGSTGKNFDYLRATCKAEKEDSIEFPQGPRTQTTNNPPKPRTTSFFPLKKFKGNQPLLKKPAVCLAHSEEEDISNDRYQESDDPSRIEGVTEEFMVLLARAVKDAQADEKCWYHCSSPVYPLVKTSREKKTVKQQGGDSIIEGSPDPSDNNQCCKEPPDRGSQGIKPTPQTPFLNPNPFQQWYGVEM